VFLALSVDTVAIMVDDLLSEGQFLFSGGVLLLLCIDSKIILSNLNLIVFLVSVALHASTASVLLIGDYFFLGD
jgi:hypothetical protein